MSTFRSCVAAFAAAIACACASAGPDPVPFVFTDITDSVGVVAPYANPPGVIVSPMLGGLAAEDFNRDGLIDLFILSGGSQPDRLLIARQGKAGVIYEDQAHLWGVDHTHLGAGVSVADYDNDGYPDLFVTSHGSSTGTAVGHHRLYRNSGPTRSGSFAFIDTTDEAGLSHSSQSRVDGFSSSWGDIDLDGDLDLFVGGWVEDSGGNRLFRNEGDGRFTDITAEAIAFDLIDTHGFTPRIVDITGDGAPEILIAADYGTSRVLLNDGTGLFTEITQSSGTGLDSNGMGATSADFNNDGLMDWYVTSIFNTSTGQDGNKLYLNLGEGVFSEAAAEAGVDDGGWGWGTEAGDIDLDGDIDIIETNGWPGSQWISERAYLFLNDGDGTSFVESGLPCGLTATRQGRGILLFDMDRDGDLDTALNQLGARTVFYRSDRAQRAGAGWLTVRLDTRSSDSLAPGGVGARVTLVSNGQTMHRWVQANSGYLSQGPTEAHFGLNGAASVESITIRYPNGRTQSLGETTANRVLTVASCDADSNGDGAVDPADVWDFIGAFTSQERRADLLPDGRFNFFDLGAFLGAYNTGCPTH